MENYSIYRTNSFKMHKLYFTFLLLFISVISVAQKSKKDTLETEEITVIKPYTPTISDAFKIKSNPAINNTDSFQKEEVNYSIFSIPVASTFTPSKGKAKGVIRVPKERLFENYVLGGLGNYITPVFETFLHSGNPRHNDYGVFLKYQSSQGGIKDVLLDDNYSDAKANIYYKQFERDFDWKVNAGYDRQRINYYGLPTNVEFTQNVINNLQEKQVYSTIYAGGVINFDNAVFKNGTAEFVNFSDFYKSNEFHFLAIPTFEFPISTELITTEVVIDFLTGNFKESYLTEDEINYSFLNIGFNPSFEVLRDDLSITIGAKLYYTFDLENSEGKFKAYPNVTASYNLIDDILIVSAGATGDLIQNTYKSFAEENPFVSPTLNINQSDQQYKAFIGAKGKLASNVGYNLNVNYSSEKDKALFIQNQIQTNGSIRLEKAYQAGNSFQVVYDHINTINAFAEINVDVTKELNFSFGIDYSNYTTTNELEAWNLPEIQASITGEYKAKNWYVGTKIFFRGATKDYVIAYGDIPENGSIITNDSYIDLNFNGGYIFNNRLSVFGKINNAVSESYQRFVNYPVQSIQFLAGITYKFDIE